MAEYDEVVFAALEEVGPLLRRAWRREKKIEHKGAIDLVTETDREVERILVEHLHRAFPEHRIIGEEGSAGSTVTRPGPEEHAWYIDPIDGTTNFAHGHPMFAVSIALLRGGEPLLGVVFDPIRNERFVARAGAGATLNEEPIRVSETADLEQALIATGFPYDARQRLDFYLGFFGDMILNAQAVRRGGSAALDLCYLACGRFDAFWEWRLHPWDTAAAQLILTEAGGRISDFAGQPFDPHGEQTLGSNGRIHEQMIEVLQRRLCGRK